MTKINLVGHRLSQHRWVGFLSLLALPLAMHCLESAATAAEAPQAKHLLTVEAKEQKEWYEQGVWPLVGPTLAIIISNAVAIIVVHLQASSSFKALLRQRKIEKLSASLSEFYNPLLALIDINGEIFEKTGPKSFPAEEPGLSAAALVWKKTKQKILANNQNIEKILSCNTHFMHESDSLQSYHLLLLHVAMYETFQQIETDIYKKFVFPSDIRHHIVSKRAIVLEEFYREVGEQG